MFHPHSVFVKDIYNTSIRCFINKFPAIWGRSPCSSQTVNSLFLRVLTMAVWMYSACLSSMRSDYEHQMNTLDHDCANFPHSPTQSGWQWYWGSCRYLWAAGYVCEACWWRCLSLARGRRLWKLHNQRWHPEIIVVFFRCRDGPYFVLVKKITIYIMSHHVLVPQVFPPWY